MDMAWKMVSSCVNCISCCTSYFLFALFSGSINWIFVQPQGAAVHNFVIRLALSMVCYFLNILPLSIFVDWIWRWHFLLVSFCHFKQVASESIKIYQAISDGTVNLVDKVSCGLNLYKLLFYLVNHVYLMIWTMTVLWDATSWCFEGFGHIPEIWATGKLLCQYLLKSSPFVNEVDF